ncbi:transcriptional regulator, MarR family (plasmid) [Rhizobium leguminosarum bv. trifolii WSM1325]|uniref:Transcriptional regulator, MarR family n=1 Tax=Rhizobium leguminosarum bv. trifolii (strain WSM1325) TaxID=395491 RepID=C6B8W0_RHILS|nr:MarR family transcriptional regulator [Rhizobium leguminosarum]ACS60348.1 transcriptional regulator, MarR family [Rhizobium leguminosarum bv. trifolii WSM1325]
MFDSSDRPISQAQRVFDELVRQWELDFPGEDSSPIAIAMRIRHLHQLDQESLQVILAPFGLGVGDIDVLTHLSQGPEGRPIRPSDLADLCMVTTGAITGRLTKLEQRSYLKRVPHPSDKRTIYVEITDAGQELLNKTREEVARSSHLLQGIRALERSERRNLVETLAKLISILPS